MSGRAGDPALTAGEARAEGDAYPDVVTQTTPPAVSGPDSTDEALDEHRIPDELLPEGVGPAWWDPEILRLAAEAHNRPLAYHGIDVKPWVVLHLLNERQRAVAAERVLADAQAENERLREYGVLYDETKRDLYEALGERDVFRGLAEQRAEALLDAAERLWEIEKNPARRPDDVGSVRRARESEKEIARAARHAIGAALRVSSDRQHNEDIPTGCADDPEFCQCPEHSEEPAREEQPSDLERRLDWEIRNRSQS